VSEQQPAAASKAGAMAGLILLALNLRGPLVAVSAVAVDLQSDLGMTAGTVGLLTSLPVLCFGLASPAASGLIGRLGIEISVLATLLVIFVGILVRSAGAVPAAFVGTVLIGLAITVGNLLGPLIVGRDFRTRAALMTGTYTAALNVGSMLVLAVSGPLAAAFGWQIALAVAAAMPVLAALVWGPLTVRARRRPAAPPGARPRTRPTTGGRSDPAGPARSVFRRPSTWLLTGAFAGQAYAYYGLTAWLPTVLADELDMTRGEAGAASSIFQIAALIGAIGAPVIIHRLGGPLVSFLVNGVLWAALPLGLLVAPDLWAVWSASSGIAQGGGFVTIFTVVVWRARTLRENRQLSSIVQTGGYCVAALGPTLLGALHDATGLWTASLLTAFAGTMVLMLLGASASIGARPVTR
jgi:CP family cyanate transporter-like MFS transporter